VDTILNLILSGWGFSVKKKTVLWTKNLGK
jgi:hypothetical protein